MTQLAADTCEACRAGAPLLSQDELKELLPQIPDWQVIEVDGVQQLKRAYSFGNFVEAQAFTNKVGEIAEAEGHHPALLLEWGSVEVRWWSHKIKGLHRNDVIMAAKTDQVFND